MYAVWRCFLKTGRCSVSVCDNRAERLKEITEKYDVDERHSSFDDVDLERYDGVVVCAPANFHVPMSRKVLEAGTGLLCEKPLSVDMDGVEEIIELSERPGAVAGVAFVRRHMPHYEMLHDIVTSGEIGVPKTIAVVGGQHYPKYRPDYKEIYYARPETGGGLIIDGMGHFLNLMEWMVGEESEVSCFYDNQVLDTKAVEDTVSMTLRYKENQAIVSLCCNQFQFHDSETVEIAGTKGYVRMAQKFISLNPWRWAVTVGICKGLDGHWEEKEFPTQERDLSYVRQAGMFLDAVEGKGSVATSIREAAQALRICLLAKKSYREKRIFDADAPL